MRFSISHASVRPGSRRENEESGEKHIIDVDDVGFIQPRLPDGTTPCLFRHAFEGVLHGHSNYMQAFIFSTYFCYYFIAFCCLFLTYFVLLAFCAL